MEKYFIESSAFIKRYKIESGSDFINCIFDDGKDIFYSNLAIIEIRKVFYRIWKYPMRQDNQISEQDFSKLSSDFNNDILKENMHRIEFTEEMILKAYEILNKAWIPNIFDLAQLSAFLVSKEEFSDLIFVCSDQRSKLISGAKHIVGDSNVIIPEQL